MSCFLIRCQISRVTASSGEVVESVCALSSPSISTIGPSTAIFWKLDGGAVEAEEGSAPELRVSAAQRLLGEAASDRARVVGTRVPPTSARACVPPSDRSSALAAVDGRSAPTTRCRVRKKADQPDARGSTYPS